MNQLMNTESLYTPTKLPKLYRVVSIKFWSLRLGIGWYGGIEEFDRTVTRKARRVLCDDGWEWQLIDEGHSNSDKYNDNVCLNDTPLDFVYAQSQIGE